MEETDDKGKLFRLVRMGKTKEVKDALVSGALSVNDRDGKGDSLFHIAARNGHKNIIRELLRRNVDFRVKNADGKLAWELAEEYNFGELGTYIREKTGMSSSNPEGRKKSTAESTDEGAPDIDVLEMNGPKQQRGGGGGGSGGGEEEEKDWRKRVDFALLLEAARDVDARHLSSISDPKFWEKMEELQGKLGGRKSDASSERRLQEVELALETVWSRYESLRKEEATGRLQSEVLSLQRRMGQGSDVEAVIDERNDLRVKLKDKEAKLEQLASKLKAMERDRGDVEQVQERLSAEMEALQSELRSAKRLKEKAEFDLQQSADALQDREIELQAVRKELQQERRLLSGIQENIGSLRGIRVKMLSSVELESLLVKHDKDGSGELSAEELKPFVEELCETMERKMQLAKEDAEREAARAEERERERERERAREKEREERLLSQVKELEKELERSQGEHQKHVESLQERSQKQKQHFEEVIESLKNEHEHEITSLKKSFDKTMEYEKKLSEERLEAKKAMMEKEAKRLQAQLDSAMSELSVKQEEAKKREERLEAKKREASKLKSLVNRLEKEAKASKSQAVLRQVMGLRPKLMETRKRFLLLRSHVFSTNESVQSMCDAMLVEMRNYCSFILPLPHEQPEKVNAEKLSGTQLVAGLKHMLGKYRGAAELCRKLNVELQNLKGSMRILCRVRPLRQVEQEDGSCVHLRGLGQLSVLDKGGSKEFHFDTTYGPKSTQEELFDDARALLQTVVDGYNVSVFAYGPTGSGKTYSITGGGGKHRGMVYRMLEDLFRTQKERAVLVSLQVKISMFEIYNEKIKDLLSGGVGEQEELRVSTDKHGSVHVEGLKEHAVESLQKGIGLLELGMSVRATGATNLNEHSSRSHLLVRLAVSGQDKRTGERTSGKMYLVDLAGSENVSLSGAEGKALKEAIGINRSLSALHDVMLSLSSKDHHIPYRNSLLTRVLSDSLGGQAKCLMYVMISPAMRERTSTLATLNFAMRCKSIVLEPAKKNVDKTVEDEMEEYKAEAEFLKDKMIKLQQEKEEVVRKLQLQFDFMMESDRFEVKVRELFGLPLHGGRKREGGGRGEGKRKGETVEGRRKRVEALYLKEADKMIVNKRQIHDELLRSLERGVQAFSDVIRGQDTTIHTLEAEISFLKSRLEHDSFERGGERATKRMKEGSDLPSDSKFVASPLSDVLHRHVDERKLRARAYRRDRFWGPTSKAKFLSPKVDRREQEEEEEAEVRAVSVPPVSRDGPQRLLPLIGGGLG